MLNSLSFLTGGTLAIPPGARGQSSHGNIFYRFMAKCYHARTDPDPADPDPVY